MEIWEDLWQHEWVGKDQTPPAPNTPSKCPPEEEEAGELRFPLKAVTEEIYTCAPTTDCSWTKR